MPQILGYPCYELSHEIEQFAGCRGTENNNVYGTHAFRRYESRALEKAIEYYPEVIIATPGGLVSESGTFNELLSHCYTVWLQAKPEEHLSRVAAQGDMRPMAGSAEAIDDLKLILDERAPFYANADMTFETSAQSLEDSFLGLGARLRAVTKRPT